MSTRPDVTGTPFGPGDAIGSYRIERLLGRGGMGAVFLAYDTTLRRHVALKVLAHDIGGDTSRARLLREARSAAALNHPNICTIYEVGGNERAAFIAMEYVAGQPLHDRLREGPLPLATVLSYGQRVARALTYAHEAGVVHRDLKAANVIVADDGGLKIVDFGLARRDDPQLSEINTQSTLVPCGLAVGTPYAMAPEQVKGETADPRADIWALGVLLYELVSARPPFAGTSIGALFSAILGDQPTPLPATVPAALRGVIEQCLEKKPDRRYQQAREVAAALEDIQAGTVTLRQTLGYFMRQRRGALAAGTFLLALASGLLWLAGPTSDGRTGVEGRSAAIRLVVLPFENLTGDPAQQYLADGLTDEITTTLGRLHPQRLSVIARTSARHYANRAAPLAQIGRELDVDYVLEGTTKREGDRLRLSATLVRVDDETQQWSDTFEREVAGILALQSDVAGALTKTLALQLLPHEHQQLNRARTVNPEAYEAYLRGVAHREKLTREDLDRAYAYFEVALEKDANYAPAHVGIASVWSGRQQMQFAAAAEAAPRLKAALGRALELDDTLAEAHYALAGQWTWTDWNWAAAEPSFRRAIDLNPNYAAARAFYAHYLSLMKRHDEARVQIEHALRLDPLNDLIQSLYGVVLQHEQRFDESYAQFRKAVQTAPRSPLALNGLARSAERLGRLDEALEIEKTIRRARGEQDVVDALDRGFAEGGYRRALRRAADTLAARPRPLAPVNIAILYARAGEPEATLDWLERGFQVRDPNLPYISVAPFYEKVRGEARFRALLEKMNLPR